VCQQPISLLNKEGLHCRCKCPQQSLGGMMDAPSRSHLSFLFFAILLTFLHGCNDDSDRRFWGELDLAPSHPDCMSVCRPEYLFAHPRWAPHAHAYRANVVFCCLPSNPFFYSVSALSLQLYNLPIHPQRLKAILTIRSGRKGPTK